MFCVVKNNSEIIAYFPNILDARNYIETCFSDWTDLGDYFYVVDNLYGTFFLTIMYGGN